MAAALLFVPVLPVYRIIGVAILIDDGLPVFYRPLRGGYKGRSFIGNKFFTVGAHKNDACLAA